MLTVALLGLALASATAAPACGPGFEGYRDLYNEPDSGPPGEPWSGAERVLAASRIPGSH